MAPKKTSTTPSRMSRPSTSNSGSSAGSNTPSAPNPVSTDDIQKMSQQVMERLNTVQIENQKNMTDQMTVVQADNQQEMNDIKNDLIQHIDTTMEVRLQGFNDHLKTIDQKFDDIKLDFDSKVNEFESKMKSHSYEDDSLTMSKSQAHDRKDDDHSLKSEYSVGDRLWYKRDPDHIYRCKVIQKKRESSETLFHIHLTDDTGYFLTIHKDFEKTHMIVNENELTRTAPRFQDVEPDVQEYDPF